MLWLIFCFVERGRDVKMPLRRSARWLIYLFKVFLFKVKKVTKKEKGQQEKWRQKKPIAYRLWRLWYLYLWWCLCRVCFDLKKVNASYTKSMSSSPPIRHHTSKGWRCRCGRVFRFVIAHVQEMSMVSTMAMGMELLHHVKRINPNHTNKPKFRPRPISFKFNLLMASF